MSKIDEAIQVAYQYAQIDGGHHKMWVIDQMIRVLLQDQYDKFIKEYEQCGCNPHIDDGYCDGGYEWNVGIAP